ncbi:hypothetical protein ACFVMC_14830 [Nocardia sp. NPDC127579]|uniref:hypothetical protein n=1 Tax=Nocardia sp. NPDC127579 TaxID=3345402 RepID=UPI00362ED3AA
MIATERVLREVVRSIEVARIVPLGHHLSILPMTDPLATALADVDGPELDEFWEAPPGLGLLLATGSISGPVAYVEAEYFGGTGTQCAQVWDAGEVVLGPTRSSAPDGATPISRALRQLGVIRTSSDEFDAVDLGRHRRTADWLPPFQ